MRTTSPRKSLWWALVSVICGALALSAIVKRTYGENDLLFLAWIAYAPVGAVVARRRPGNAIGWLFLLVGVIASLGVLFLAVVDNALSDGPPFSTAEVLAALYTVSMVFPLVLFAATFTFLLYPSGLLSPRWRPVLWLGFGVLGLFVLFPFFLLTVPVIGTGADADGFEVANPVGLTRLITAPDNTFNVGLTVMVGLTLAAISSALLRAWRATGVERLQMRLFAASVVVLLASLWPAQYLATHGHSLGRFVLLAMAFALIPVSCGVAILRYHLYDIDRVIGRTTAYVLVTGVLLVVYGVVVTSVGRLLPDASDLGVALATLTAAALFRPVLTWARKLVARRFNRESFNADRVVEAFASTLREQVDPVQVQAELVVALEQTVQPSLAGIWLQEPAP